MTLLQVVSTLVIALLSVDVASVLKITRLSQFVTFKAIGFSSYAFTPPAMMTLHSLLPSATPFGVALKLCLATVV